jgi:chemotaxis protein histidine kinase CheA
MQIEEVSACPFGGIERQTIRLHDGLNIVVGANGTGKSTWHAAMFAAQYGQPAPADQTPADTRFQQRWAPASGEWAVTATLRDADGEHTLNRDLLAGIDAATYRPEIDRYSYAATAWVEQEDTASMLSAAGGGNALQRAVAACYRHDQLLAALAWVAEKRDYLTAGPEFRLRTAIEAHERALLRERRYVDYTKRQQAALAAKEQVGADRRARERALATANARELRVEADDLAARIEELAGPPAGASWYQSGAGQAAPPTEVDAEVADAAEALASAEAALTAAEAEAAVVAAEAEAARAQAEREAEAARAQIAWREAARREAAEAEAARRDAAREAARQAAEHAHAQRLAAEQAHAERLAAEEAEAQRQAAARAEAAEAEASWAASDAAWWARNDVPPTRRIPVESPSRMAAAWRYVTDPALWNDPTRPVGILVVGGVLTLLGIVIAAATQQAAWLFLAIVGLLVVIIGIAQRLAAAATPPPPAAVNYLANPVPPEVKPEAGSWVASGSLTPIATPPPPAEPEIADEPALDAELVDDGEYRPSHLSWSAEDDEDLEPEPDQVRVSEIPVYEFPTIDLAPYQRRVDFARYQLALALRDRGYQGENVRAELDRYRADCTNNARQANERKTALEQLRAQHAVAERRAAEAANGLEAWEISAAGDAPDARRALAAAIEAVHRADVAVDTAAALVAELLADDPADPHTALIQATRRRDRLEQADRVLAETAECLRRAKITTFREAATGINDRIEEDMQAITGNDHVSVHVDHDLNIVLVESGRRGNGRGRGSNSTVRLAYMFTRIALGRYLARGRHVPAAPLLLDDISSNADARRLPRVLDHLLRVARHRQVVVFAHDDATLRWARKQRGTDQPVHLIHLTDVGEPPTYEDDIPADDVVTPFRAVS